MSESVCFYCKGDMKPSCNTHFSELDNCIVIIKKVPCFKCSQCSEVVYSLAMVRKIEDILKEFKTAKTEIVIMNYENNVA
jgi:YgiT-type zinc finger domain-containing protein